MLDILATDMTAAADQGRICALAARGQRELTAYAHRHPRLFPAEPFDATLFGAISSAMAFGAPDRSPAELGFANRCVLWGFAVDWLIDSVATSRTEIEALAARCLAVADGAQPEPGDDLGRLLADQRDELADRPGFARARLCWRTELDNVLTAMAREWSWRERSAAGALPTLDEYLDNADNLGCTVVNVAYWIRIGDADVADRLPALVAASGAVQRALRLVNDLGTYERDLRWGDLNSIMVAGDRSAVERRLDELVGECHERLGALRTHRPAEAAYLSRQLGFSTGFYQLGDFWVADR
ncbi:terpene synthase family protein [Plantactinospora siamensis]|uniref:Terpene synthase family protein n=1 Tax=Plantactinospora siamensis TaxID=555372 RepID=A0ABV6NZ78_9ACTN